MDTRKSLIIPSIALSAFALSCSASDEDGPPPIGTSTCPRSTCIGTGSGSTSDASVTADSADGASIIEASFGLSDVESYEGARSSGSGMALRMKPPEYDAVTRELMEPLEYPVRIHLPAYNYDYVRTAYPDGGFSLEGVPSGTFFIMAEDIDGKNDVLTTVFGQIIGGTGRIDVPLTPKTIFEGILNAVNPPIQIDPTKAQLLVTIQRATFDPTRISGVAIAPPARAEAVVYSTASGWTRDENATTSLDGLAIVANMDAAPFPGNQVTLKYSKSDENRETPLFTVCQGAVTRVQWCEGFTSGP